MMNDLLPVANQIVSLRPSKAKNSLVKLYVLFPASETMLRMREYPKC